MKKIEVVAAIIIEDRKLFATQRGYGEFKDKWEFPGGKIEPGETPEQALKREILEELDTEIAVDGLIRTIEWDYPAFHLVMHCYRSRILKGELLLKEHEASAWLDCAGLLSVDWLPADYQILPDIKALLEVPGIY